ncbi:MAG TPA: SLC13 family permease [Candidatus Methanoculleus thermohydrogenotrophicum]|nr:SLC13 family permease [Candidatus Methanoculleus thermohydrogenotrophicum]HQE09652.1 SLC13 family permease [Bacillota bacterium]NLM81983.1 anion transporter [Candidatus Methanoculleus thermohydrogenotrophicum]HOB17474.1 SLC13 family permease [Candidatus Methanoculleus thermohydrogenotrophicum]HPZ37629.1 SLC13 family permease [Candidatus Methanoculleus thermohydrogenotrophicum]
MASLISIVVLIIVFLLIAVRKVGNVNLGIWQVMLLGAVAVLLTGEITPEEALASIDMDVMLFLFGMFVVGEALAESGYLYHLASRLFSRAETVGHLVFLILIGAGALSALLMNDTLAVVGTPLMLYFARRHDISPKLLLLALAFAITTGSVASPIGNPQNLLIALSGNVENPFIAFPLYLAIPTVISLLVAYTFLCRAFRDEFRPAAVLVHREEEIHDSSLAALARLSLILLVSLIGVKVVVVMLFPGFEIGLTWIALFAALPILVGSRRRLEILRRIDWPTLVFFASLFVLMASVWQSGFFQPLIEESSIDLSAVPVIVTVSVIVSQFVSNVPFVALFLPVLAHLGTSTVGMMALAAGSTIAGNMLILGAASNVIIIQSAEKSGETLTFWEFARVGVPLTVVQTAIYVLFLSLFPT